VWALLRAIISVLALAFMCVMVGLECMLLFAEAIFALVWMFRTGTGMFSVLLLIGWATLAAGVGVFGVVVLKGNIAEIGRRLRVREFARALLGCLSVLVYGQREFGCVRQHEFGYGYQKALPGPRKARGTCTCGWHGRWHRDRERAFEAYRRHVVARLGSQGQYVAQVCCERCAFRGTELIPHGTMVHENRCPLSTCRGYLLPVKRPETFTSLVDRVLSVGSLTYGDDYYLRLIGLPRRVR
jgi:hypothetical protein